METKAIACQYDIPFHEKGEDYTCDATALRMAIHGLTGVDFTEERLANMLGTDSTVGSPLILFEKNLESIKEFNWQGGINNPTQKAFVAIRINLNDLIVGDLILEIYACQKEKLS